MRRDLRTFAILLTAIAGPALLIAGAGCYHGADPARRTPSGPPPISKSEAYSGNGTCRACHAAEYAQYIASRHSIALRALDPARLGSLAPPAGPIPDSDILMIRDRTGYRIAKKEDPAASAPVQLVFGSGKTGMTPATILSSGEMIEIGRSYFPSRHVWYVTPGHESRPKAEMGLRCTTDEALRCMRCHSVTQTAGTVVPQPEFRGVGCESCHGPARAHVEAMRAGNSSDLKIARLGSLGAAESIQTCSGCHRGRSSVDLRSEQAHMTNRFQAFGLMQSRCFLESKNRLSCVTCHNPHADAATDLKSYDRACLSCHSGAPATAATAHGAVCPVNPTGRCIGCHMPSRPVFKSASLPVEMAEHFIRVYANRAQK